MTEFEVNLTTKRISAKRFCENFDEVLDDIQRTGCKYLVTKSGRGHVKLVPVSALQNLRAPLQVKKKRRNADNDG